MMKQGLDHIQLLDRVKTELPLKEDFVVDSRNINFSVTDDNAVAINPTIIIDDINYSPSEHMLGQVANKLNIPKKYFNRMLSDAPLLAKKNVDHWLKNEVKPYMVRTVGNTARAFLSDRYSIIDNWDVLNAVLPALKPFAERQDLNFEQCHVTDQKMYMRLTVPSMKTEILKGDIVNFGLQVSNSEVGLGQVEVSPFLKRLVCLNGMVATEYGKNKKHLGVSIWDGTDKQILREETIIQGNKAWVMTIQDEVNSMFSGTTFEDITNKIISASESLVIERPAKAIEIVTKQYEFSELESEKILENLLLGKDHTKWGLANAITASAGDSKNADRSMDLESIGFKMLNVPDKNWNDLATAT